MNIITNKKITALPTLPASGFIKTPVPHLPKVRILLLPDWQGGGTSYMQRMATQLNTLFAAEVIILHQYQPTFSPTNYPVDGRPAVRQLLRNRQSCRAWMVDILRHLQPHWRHDDCPLMLIGFCLGGTLAFEAARHSNTADLAISVHGNPGTDMSLKPEYFDTQMVYIRGGSDPLIPALSEELFFKEMRCNKRQWFCHTIGNSRHSFTKEEVGYEGPGSVFDEQAMALSFQLIACHVRQKLSQQHSTTAISAMA